MADFPTSIKAWTDLVDGVSPANSSDINSAYDEITAVETILITLPNVDGWTPVTVTWTYASATTITVPSGAAAIYSIGDKIRFKQGAGYKYFYVVIVADTLLTVTGGSDYTVATPTAITDIYYSHQVSPIAFPRYFNYTCTITYSGGTTDPTSNTITYARFSILTPRIANIDIKSALVLGTGNRTNTYFSLPFAESGSGVMLSMNDITAAGLKTTTLCYPDSSKITVKETMAQNGTYYISSTLPYA